MAPQVLQLKEIEPPRELAAALSSDFLGRLDIANPPAVRISVPPEAAAWGGYCSSDEFSESGEVVLADWRHYQEWRVVERIRQVYVHETAHRLLSKPEEVESHGIEFFTLLLFLFRRAGTKKGDRPWLISAGLYDCQDCLEPRGIAGVPSLGESADFALKLAMELADQEITAEQAAQEICRRAQKWKEWKAEEPARREAARKKQETTQAALAVARDKIFWWRWATFMLAVVAGICCLLL